MDKILVIVAHPDDEIIGVGGTLRKHIKQGEDVEVLILGDGKTSRFQKYRELDSTKKSASVFETSCAMKKLGISTYYREYFADNRFDSIALLDIVKLITQYIEKVRPTLIYTHHYGDLNIDHQRTAEAVIIATRPIENFKVNELRMFETLSSTEMAGSRQFQVFIPNLFINIEHELDDKLAALRCYKSELENFPHPRSVDAITFNAQVWGAKNKMLAVEPFYIFRKSID